MTFDLHLEIEHLDYTFDLRQYSLYLRRFKEIVLRCSPDFVKNVWVIFIILEILGKCHEFFDQLRALQLILWDCFFRDRLADEVDKEYLLFDGHVSVMAKQRNKVLRIIYEVVVPRVFIHLHLLPQNMHRVRLSQFIDEWLQTFLDCFQKRWLPVVNNSFVRVHFYQWQHTLGHANALAVEINYLICDRFKVLNEVYFILLKHQWSWIFIHYEDGCHRGVFLTECTGVLHDFIAQIDRSKGLVSEIEYGFLFEVMQEDIIEYE